MSDKEKNDLFYVCALIEFMARVTKNHRSKIVGTLGKDEIGRQLKMAEVNHCLSFEQVSDELIGFFNIEDGVFDTVATCKYDVPSYLAIGKAYQRLILDVKNKEEKIEDAIVNVFTSFISDEISNFNSSVYYRNPDYLKCSFIEGKLLG